MQEKLYNPLIPLFNIASNANQAKLLDVNEFIKNIQKYNPWEKCPMFNLAPADLIWALKFEKDDYSKIINAVFTHEEAKISQNLLLNRPAISNTAHENEIIAKSWFEFFSKYNANPFLLEKFLEYEDFSKYLNQNNEFDLLHHILQIENKNTQNIFLNHLNEKKLNLINIKKTHYYSGRHTKNNNAIGYYLIPLSTVNKISTKDKLDLLECLKKKFANVFKGELTKESTIDEFFTLMNAYCNDSKRIGANSIKKIYNLLNIDEILNKNPHFISHLLGQITGFFSAYSRANIYYQDSTCSKNHRVVLSFLSQKLNDYAKNKDYLPELSKSLNLIKKLNILKKYKENKDQYNFINDLIDCQLETINTSIPPSTIPPSTIDKKENISFINTLIHNNDYNQLSLTEPPIANIQFQIIISEILKGDNPIPLLNYCVHCFSEDTESMSPNEFFTTFEAINKYKKNTDINTNQLTQIENMQTELLKLFFSCININYKFRKMLFEVEDDLYQNISLQSTPQKIIKDFIKENAKNLSSDDKKEILELFDFLEKNLKAEKQIKFITECKKMYIEANLDYLKVDRPMQRKLKL